MEMLIYDSWVFDLAHKVMQLQSQYPVVYTELENVDRVFEEAPNDTILITNSNEIGIKEATDSVYTGVKFFVNGTDMNRIDVDEFSTVHVVGYNDYQLRLLRKIPRNIKKWYSNNISSKDKRLQCLPLGIKSSAHDFISKYKDSKKDKLLYINFDLDIDNYHSDIPCKFRNQVFNSFEESDWVTIEKDVTPDEYYKNLARHKFAFAPQGNSIDTCRVWECLYLGVIPIVEGDSFTGLFENLPILEVDKANWLSITPEFLDRNYEELDFTKYGMKQLTETYWVEHICDLQEAI